VGVPSEASRPGGGRHTPEPSQEDEAIEEAQFSDAEEGPPTPSLEEEKRSFALSGVVAADAWQAGG
jgi:hypothetical protein